MRIVGGSLCNLCLQSKEERETVSQCLQVQEQHCQALLQYSRVLYVDTVGSPLAAPCQTLSGKGFLERVDVIARGNTVLEAHGVDHLARNEHVGLQPRKSRSKLSPIGFFHAVQ